MRRSEGSHVSALHIRLIGEAFTTEAFQGARWRPLTPSRPGGLILADKEEPIAVATLALADIERAALVDLLHHDGRRSNSL